MKKKIFWLIKPYHKQSLKADNTLEESLECISKIKD